jgi:hypothetical protein
MWMAACKRAGLGRRWAVRWGAVLGSLWLPAAAFGQQSPAGGGSETTPAPAGAPAAPAAEAPPVAEPAPAPAPAVVPKPPAFTFTLKGFISGTMYGQDAAFGSGNGDAAIFSPSKTDKWFLGGDVRQAQLKFMVKGPEVIGGIPTGVVEVDFFGGNQINSVPANPPTSVPVKDTMGNTVGTAMVPNAVTSSNMGDESVLPRLRLAYVDLNWGDGMEILRVGQFHNLLIPMIPASASHIGVPLGYGAGALGWRTPGVTYFQKVPLKGEMKLDLALQLNRNSWIDNEPACGTGQNPATGTNCLPFGISMGEASGLPQVEARALLSSGKTESPWAPYYANNDWQVYLVGHWDQKSLGGVGPSLPAQNAAGTALRNTLQTYVGELGFKVKAGPVLVAGNGWYGMNSGGVFGNLLQMQLPTVAAEGHDVSGFGAWGQLGVNITKELAVWGFGGIDQPNQDDARAAGFSRLRNIQVAGMVSYRDGPYAIAAEFLHIWTDTAAPTMADPKAVATAEGNQPSASVIYFF